MNTTELTVMESAPLSAIQVRGQVNLIQEVMRDVMKNGEHFGTIPGCGDKPTLLQPGAQKLLMTFQIVADPDMTIIDLGSGHREVRCKVKLYNRAGVFLGAGVGTCSTLEGKYRFRKAEQKCPSCGRETIIKGRQEYGGGWLCFQKKGGCNAKFKDGDPAIENQNMGRVEHDNPADYYNTVEKMSYKRALVGGTLTVTAASDIFTQDLEDMPEVLPHAITGVARERATNTRNMEQLKKVEQDGAGNETAHVTTQQVRDAAPPLNDETPTPTDIPPLNAGNTCQQFVLCESVAEWADLANSWQEQAHLHPDEDRARVKKAADTAKVRLTKRK